MRTFAALFAFTALLCFSVNVSAQEITKKRGKYKFYFPSGKVSATGKVKNYHRHGKWKYYDEQGNVVTVANFVFDTIHGAYQEFYPSGKSFITGTYCMNRKCGNWKTYDDKDQLISNENFENGDPHGVQRYWYPGGVLRDSIIMDHNTQVYHQSWYPAGTVKLIETYSNGLPEGKWYTYPEVPVDTFPATTDEYHHGLKHGWHYAWTGRTLVRAFHYANGELDGTSSRYDEQDGKLTVEESYTNGQLNGTSKYYRNGSLLRIDNYSNGQRHGMQDEYAREGYVMKRKWYSHGVLDSVYSYHANGKTAVVQKYIPGTTNSTWKEWDANGNFVLEGFLKNERRDGNWCVYYTSGSKHSCTPYKEGVITGVYTKWYPNGKKMLEYEIDAKGAVVNTSVWNAKGKALKKGTKEFNEIYEGNLPGSIFTDVRDFNRNIIDRVVNDGRIAPKQEAQLDRPAGSPDDLNEPLWWQEPQSPDTEVYSYCEIMPDFPGGTLALHDFLLANLHYPQDSSARTIAFVEYIVEKDGSVTNVKAARYPDDPFTIEAVRVVRMFPKQAPAKQNGQAVRCRIILPVRVDVEK
jgi:antitoxin component YwqK of YwqJK toxin-antitoxin module